jgi:hypothetical protein
MRCASTSATSGPNSSEHDLSTPELDTSSKLNPTSKPDTSFSDPRRVFDYSCTSLQSPYYDYERGWAAYAALRDAGRLNELKTRMILTFASRCAELILNVRPAQTLPSSSANDMNEDPQTQTRCLWGQRITEVLITVAPRFMLTPNIRRDHGRRWHTLAIQARILRGDTDVVLKEHEASVLQRVRLDINASGKRSAFVGDGAPQPPALWSALDNNKLACSTYDIEDGWKGYTDLRNARRLKEVRLRVIHNFAARCIELVQSRPLSARTSSEEELNFQYRWGERIIMLITDLMVVTSTKERLLHQARWLALAGQAQALRGDIDAALYEADKLSDLDQESQIKPTANTTPDTHTETETKFDTEADLGLDTNVNNTDVKVVDPWSIPGLGRIYGSCLLSVSRRKGIPAALAFIATHVSAFRASIQQELTDDSIDVKNARRALFIVVGLINGPRGLLLDREHAERWGPEATEQITRILVTVLCQLRRVDDVLAVKSLFPSCIQGQDEVHSKIDGPQVTQV